MLWQLVKFRFKITFRKSAIIVFIAELLLFTLISYFFSVSHLPLALYMLDIMGIFLLSLFFIVNGVYSSFFIQKPDVDFLYLLPLDEKELKNSLLLYGFLANLLMTIVVAILLFPTISYLSFLVVLMSAVISTFTFFAFKRKIIVVIIGVWMLSSILKLPFSPFSMVFGYTYGYFILAGLSVMTLILGIRNASVEGLILEFYKRQGLLPQPGKITTSISLYYSSPFIAMLKRNFNFIEYGARTALGGSPYLTRIRVKTYKILLVTVIIGIIIYVVTSLVKGQNPHLAYFIESNVGMTAGILILSFTTQSAFVDEPLWLNLSTMTPIEFARSYLLAKTLSAFVLFLPISISVILLNPAIGIGSLFIPLLCVYNASINARFYPVSSQISAYDLRVLSASPLIFLSVIPIILDFYFPIGGIVATLALTLPFLFSKGYWEKTFEKTITSL